MTHKTATTENKKAISSKPGNTFAIKRPWITEKSYRMSHEGRYVFLVDTKTNKNEVKKAVKEVYKVDPISVNIVNMQGKIAGRYGRNVGKKHMYKKAIVTLKAGQKLDLMPS